MMNPPDKVTHWPSPARSFLALALCLLAGCGVLAERRTEFPNEVRTADGRRIFVEDVREIVDNPLLSEDQKRDALGELGIEDDDLVQALLSLP